MNQDSINLSARRFNSRIKNNVEQSMNKVRDMDTLRMERNFGAGQQVRNIGGTIRTDVFAYFGIGGGGTTVGA